MIIRLTRSILVLLISTMVLMGQGGAFAASDEGVQMRRGEAGIFAAVSKTARNRPADALVKSLSQNDLLAPVALLSGASSCCVCSPSGAGLAQAPLGTFSKMARATGPAIFEALDMPPPHDPPRI